MTGTIGKSLPLWATALALLCSAPAWGQPPVPTNFQATAGTNSITASWTASAGAGGYIIWFDSVNYLPGEDQYTDPPTARTSVCCTIQVIGAKTEYTIDASTPIGRTGPPNAGGDGYVSGNRKPLGGFPYRLQIQACPGEHFSLSLSYTCSGLSSVVTVTPTKSADATLSGLTASGAGAGGVYNAFSLSPQFSSSTTEYTATVSDLVTHVKLTPTVGESHATVGWRKGSTGTFTAVTSGSASGAIAVAEGTNTITVRVTAQSEATKDYTVTITRSAPPSPPGKPTGLSVTSPDYKILAASWQAPSSGVVEGYDVRYAIHTGVDWPPNDTIVSTTATTVTISDIDAGTYQVRVRTKNRTGVSQYTSPAVKEVPAWSLTATATPTACGRVY